MLNRLKLSGKGELKFDLEFQALGKSTLHMVDWCVTVSIQSSPIYNDWRTAKNSGNYIYYGLHCDLKIAATFWITWNELDLIYHILLSLEM